ncbi:response regulator transcription factor [Actinokineospora bangkokensis]|uniref:LuxR family transcriptional regulator n=1 Tax=Actinokineospora bangkokensis TaxID=1193682 RepID=A0A1Q9LC63_9PSEU|nr:response regulator transcription factor [Actinokineospora bangkokensis]OLR89604.1 LuxR family transcriptional regulator [Actinokineospora bangkokensis]
MRTEGIAVVHGMRELWERTAHLFTGARSEVSCAADQYANWVRLVSPARRSPAGVRVRKLYHAGLMLDPGFSDYARRMASLGAQVRVPTREMGETILIDGRVAILAGGSDAGTPTFSVITVPEVVHGVSGLFESAWVGATPLAAWDATSAELRAIAPRVLEVLAAGAKDETAARTVGLSVRTYRRRVAELMAALGAETRFQAGVRARELGLI